MLTRREFLTAGTAVAALAATPSGVLAQTPGRHQRMRDAVPPTSPNPVSARPPDNLGGSTVNVGGKPGDLQAAINASMQGDTLICPAGVTYNPITLPIRTGPGWTCIRTNGTLTPGTRVAPSSANQMFKILSGGEVNTARALIVRPGTQGWRFIGMEATHPNDNPQYGLIDLDGSRLSLDRCYVHGRPTQTFMARCFMWRATDAQIWDSWVSDAQAVGQDAQAIFFRNSSLSHVENCELQGTGENIMLGDQGSDIACRDVTIKRSHFFKPLKWRKFLASGAANPSWDGAPWPIKELFEIKWAHRALMEGCVLENNWAQGQDGTASLFTSGRVEGTVKELDTHDVMIRSNIYKSCPYMFGVATAANSGIAVARVAILNNLGSDIGGRALFCNWRSSDTWFEHNTVVPMNGFNIESFAGNGPQGAMMLQFAVPGDSPRHTFKRNVLGFGTYGINLLTGQAATTAVLDQWLPDRAWTENALYDYNPAYAALAGISYYANAAAAGVNLTTGTLASNSRLKKAGSDGKDLGVDFAALNAAQQDSNSA